MSSCVRKPVLGFSFCSHSLSELTKSGSNARNGVLGVGEWRSVLSAPGELRAYTGNDLLFLVGIRSQVTNLLLGGLHAFNSRAELNHLLDGHLSGVSNVMHHLELSQVSHVVGQVQLEIPLHSYVEGLHLLSGSSTSRYSRVNGELRIEEAFILGLDSVNNVRGMDGVSVHSPIDLFTDSSSLARVVVVEDRGKLTVGLTSLTRSSGCS